MKKYTLINPFFNWQPIYFFKMLKSKSSSGRKLQTESDALILSCLKFLFQFLIEVGKPRGTNIIKMRLN